jgi:hypothetical protein
MVKMVVIKWEDTSGWYKNHRVVSASAGMIRACGASEGVVVDCGLSSLDPARHTTATRRPSWLRLVITLLAAYHPPPPPPPPRILLTHPK